MNSLEKSHSEANSGPASQECYFLCLLVQFPIFTTYWFRIREKEMAVWPSRHVTDLSSSLFRLKLSSHFECTVVIVSFRAVDVDAECEAS
jgi:hypothetical protein